MLFLLKKPFLWKNEAIDIEKLSYWLDKYEGKIGVGRCSCRASRKAIGDGCADDDFGWCIGVWRFLPIIVVKQAKDMILLKKKL